jgi:sugar diacid utilization regulator
MTAVLRWPDIGIYGLLTPLLEGGPRLNELPTALMRLLQDRRGDVLLQTLEAYLDNAGDAQATAAELSLARGSLYYRLNRIAAITQSDLRSGQDRLMLHVGLKLARLSGLYSS